ncbi:hypothetical protein P171DRAFT_132236 [Karstenula rhodostoma CBS 690.94]|uniref:DUF7730 domain-containing protein n=1 Tax=Karstenula rhodostoma CBS 690.94 TaxID=1392251 RepID=A0A9P4U6U6_9PLEO|nr:hypothetical protein P171DRAFT_132236 [Karstenula rhodostoma CBS 690.94]
MYAQTSPPCRNANTLLSGHTRSRSLPSEWRIGHPASEAFQPTLPNLPYELRFKIYGYIFHNTLIHIRRRRNSVTTSDFAWAPCIQPSLHGSICLGAGSAHSEYESSLNYVHNKGLCGQAVEHKGQAISITALIWTCRAIASEALEIFCRVATISLNINDSPGCFRYISAIHGLQIQRITLSGTLNVTTPPPLDSGFRVTLRAETFDPAPLLGFFPNLVCINLQIRSHFEDFRAWDMWQKAAAYIHVQQIEVSMYTEVWDPYILLLRHWQRMRHVQELWMQDSMRIVLHRTFQALPELEENAADAMGIDPGAYE